ncbi:MAG: ABC transporter permease [Atribacterota bacterium]
MNIKTFQFSYRGLFMIKKFIARIGPLFVLLVIVIIAAFFVPRFFTILNLINVIYQASIYIILAVGMTFVITGGGIDLSIGSQVALVSVVMSGLIQASNWPVGFAMGFALIMGMGLGYGNGFIITRLKIPDFIVTLATMETFRGFALVHSAGKIWFEFPASLRYIGTTRWLGLPIPAIVALIIAFIGYQIYHKSYFGRYTIAIGGNRDAAILCGIPVDKYKVYQYVLMGGLCGLAAILLTSRLNSSQATMASGYEIHTIAAVIMGGTSLRGGLGSVVGSLVGALILGIISNTMVLLGVDYFWRLVATGLIIILAVALNFWRENVIRQTF